MIGDITKLKGPVTWTCFSLYVILDIYSRDVLFPPNKENVTELSTLLCTVKALTTSGAKSLARSDRKHPIRIEVHNP